MLTRNYVAIADQTQQQVFERKSTRRHRSWSWNPKNRKPGKVVTINPNVYDKERTQC
jgi:hypothetical protein